MVRGCFHTESGISLRAFTRLCHEDGCNKEPFVSPSRLKCEVCTDTDRCDSQLMTCNHDVLLYRKEFCYAALPIEGKWIVKGCLLEANEHVQKMCNPMDVHRDRCLTCQHDGCNKSLQPIVRYMCMSTLVNSAVNCKSYRNSDRTGCFARTTGEAPIPELGCNTQLTEEEFQDCADLTNNTCQLCMTPMCNDLKQGR